MNNATLHLDTTLDFTIYPIIFHPDLIAYNPPYFHSVPSLPTPMHDPMPTVNTNELLAPGHVLQELPASAGRHRLLAKNAPFTPACLVQEPTTMPSSPTQSAAMHSRLLSIMPDNAVRMASLLVLHANPRDGGVCLDGLDLEQAVEEVAARIIQRTIKAACEKDTREQHPLASMSSAAYVSMVVCQWASVEGVGENRAKWLRQRDAWEAVCNAH